VLRWAWMKKIRVLLVNGKKKEKRIVQAELVHSSKNKKNAQRQN
jgi:hypothetical protein